MCYVCVLNECMYWCVVWDYMHVVGVVYVCYVYIVQMCECEYVGVHPESQEKIESPT